MEINEIEYGQKFEKIGEIKNSWFFEKIQKIDNLQLNYERKTSNY